jgi:hypothetical protein
MMDTRVIRALLVKDPGVSILLLAGQQHGSATSSLTILRLGVSRVPQ